MEETDEDLDGSIGCQGKEKVTNLVNVLEQEIPGFDFLGSTMEGRRYHRMISLL